MKASQMQADIRFGPTCNHHVLCYCAALDYGLADWKTMGPRDDKLAVCIRGPTT
jgi:hypothetical protein